MLPVQALLDLKGMGIDIGMDITYLKKNQAVYLSMTSSLARSFSQESSGRGLL